ncbi:MAG TPA: hypothetical protein VL360_01300 [Gammaproteobacteria bacterium]|jgi:hypothetical protein|nr:hypothetical protein [Gammaproteobacteria bacterium]
MRLLILSGLSFILAGCATGSSAYYTQSVQSWRGGNISDLTNIWGRPDTIMPGSTGNTVYVYKRQSFVSTNSSYSPSIGVNTRNGGIPVITSTPNINTPWNRGFSTYCLAVFTSNSKGKIINTEIQGTNCYISETKARGLMNPKG